MVSVLTDQGSSVHNSSKVVPNTRFRNVAVADRKYAKTIVVFVVLLQHDGRIVQVTMTLGASSQGSVGRQVTESKSIKMVRTCIT